MVPRILAAALVAMTAGCGPPYAWGEADAVEQRLLDIVPVGSPPSQLLAEARSRDWKVNTSGIYVGDGGPTYFDDTRLRCRSMAGVRVIPVIIASYFTTTVETLWLYDRLGKLSRVCVRKTVDAP